MDGNRFDSWTRRRALKLSRRNAFRLAGAGGGGMALAHYTAAAQQSCTLNLHAETAAGPSAATTYDGTLQFTIGSDGTLDQAAYTPTGGAAVSVAGSIAGRAVDLLISLDGNRTLTLSGVADRPGPACPSVMAGVISGPQPADLGGWQATGSTTATSGTGQSGGSTSTGATAGTCAAPQTPCGANCWPSGATCTNATQGICTCPNGTAQCGTACVQNCPAGQTLDLDSCSCTANCVSDNNACTTDTDCCSGSCMNGICLTCPVLACPEIGCVDPSFDNNNCGGCGIVCSAPKASCTDGVCACQVDGMPCTKHYDCCSDSCANGVCGCLTVGNDCSNFDGTCCGNGTDTACVNDVCRYLDARHACFSDNECITGICKNGACASCLDPLEGPCTRDAECCNYNGLGCVNGICPQ